MLTAMYTVKNIMGANYNVWDVNVEQEYHEEIDNKNGQEVENEAKEQMALLASTQPLVPQRIKAATESVKSKEATGNGR